MANRLANENSPYLLQHAENPVDWYPWGEEALEKARREEKPIFLSIGYAACHWCHVMAHESFEDPETALLMNENFVNIKVDREERPDLDGIYMNAVVAIAGQGGWPMSVFLTPEGKPFYGGTYFPPVRRYNMPSFQEVLLSVLDAWQKRRNDVLKSGEQIAEHLQQEMQLGTGEKIDENNLQQAAEELAQGYDWKYGGWGKAPKFPQPMAIEFLLRKATRGDKFAQDIALHALHAMAKGGMYDVVGGGFARYSTDDLWLVPHFEKMLYDNAQLSSVYLYAYLLTGEAGFMHVCEDTLNFVSREMTGPQGGFYSSLDADSEGEEGKYYVWTPEEVRQAITNPDDQEIFFAAYDIKEEGNFEGSNVLQRTQDDQALSESFSIPIDEVPDKLNSLHSLLLVSREERIRPGTDDKVLTSWNGLMLRAFAEAARYLNRWDYLRIAEANASFITTAMYTNGRLLRSWRDGKAQHKAYLEDYAALILGLLSLYQADHDPRWFSVAENLGSEMNELFAHEEWGFYDTGKDHETLFTRPRDTQDNATPSGNSLAAMALLQLSAYTGNGEWRERAERMLGRMQSPAKRYPTAFGNWLSAMDFAIGPVLEVAMVSPGEAGQLDEMLRVIWSEYRPRLVTAASTYPPPKGSPPLLQDRPMKDGKPTAYVCENFTCQMPANTTEEMAEQIRTA